MNNRIFTFVYITILCTLCAQCVSKNLTDKIDPEEQAKRNLTEFDAFIDDVASSYIYLENDAKIIDCIKENYRSRSAQITNKQEHIKFYEELLFEFTDNHLQLDVDHYDSYKVTSPIYLELVSDSVIIKNVWHTQLNNELEHNIVNARVIAYNEHNIYELIDEFPASCIDKTSAINRNWIANKIVTGRRTGEKKLTIKLVNGTTVTIDLNTLMLRKEKYFITARYLEDKKIGYLRINNTLDSDELVSEMERFLSKMENTQALILDLRNTTSGGNTGVARPILGKFITEKLPYQVYDNGREKYSDVVKPNPKIYHKPLFVLVGKWTGSMGEGMAIGLDGMNRATILGTTMEGLAGSMDNFKFKYQDYNYRLSTEKIFHVNGSPREDFIPGIVINQSQNKTDEVLDFTVDLIRTSL